MCTSPAVHHKRWQQTWRTADHLVQLKGGRAKSNERKFRHWSMLFRDMPELRRTHKNILPTAKYSEWPSLKQNLGRVYLQEWPMLFCRRYPEPPGGLSTQSQSKDNEWHGLIPSGSPVSSNQGTNTLPVPSSACPGVTERLLWWSKMLYATQMLFCHIKGKVFLSVLALPHLGKDKLASWVAMVNNTAAPLLNTTLQIL